MIAACNGVTLYLITSTEFLTVHACNKALGLSLMACIAITSSPRITASKMVDMLCELIILKNGNRGMLTVLLLLPFVTKPGRTAMIFMQTIGMGLFLDRKSVV